MPTTLAIFSFSFFLFLLIFVEENNLHVCFSQFMTRSSSSRLLDLDLEIDRTFRRKLKSSEEIVRNLNFDEQSESEEAMSVAREESSMNSGDRGVEPIADEYKTMVDYARPTLGST